MNEAGLALNYRSNYYRDSDHLPNFTGIDIMSCSMNFPQYGKSAVYKRRVHAISSFM